MASLTLKFALKSTVCESMAILFPFCLTTLPLSRARVPKNAFKRLDFPSPFFPMMAIFSPSLALKFASFKTIFSPNFFEASIKSISAIFFLNEV